MGYGLWVMGYGFWVLGFGFWVLGIGFWVMGYGLWVWIVFDVKKNPLTKDLKDKNRNIIYINTY